jgi:hypothetical protein
MEILIKPLKSSVRITGAPAGIRIENFPNKILDHHI